MQLPLFEISKKNMRLADVHTSKRGKNERAGVHAWHSYYAGYAEQFVEDVLAILAEPGDVVLAPWNGSGTTTLVAQRQGLNAIRVDINPVMTLHSLAKNLRFAHRSDEILQESQALVASARRLVSRERDVPGDVGDWVPEEPLLALLALRDAIRQHVPDVPPPAFARDLARPDLAQASFPSKKKAFFFSALFQVLRTVGSFSRGSNPTWLLLDDGATSTPADQVIQRFSRQVASMLQDVRISRRNRAETADYWVVAGDARELGQVDDAIDLVVTSPPYCTRIDYAVATKPELLLLGYGAGEVDTLRRVTMGAPVIVDKSIVRRPTWGQTCNDFLAAVAAHPSKSSGSYYLPNYLQYFRDAEASLREINRVLKADGRAIVVVQSSYYKDVELPLGVMYVEMAEQLGFQAEIARREVLRQHMAHVNTKSRRYVKDKVYYEDVLLLRPQP